MVCLPEEKASVYTEAFFGLLEEVTFDGIGQFGFEEFFPNSVRLAGDGFGNLLQTYETNKIKMAFLGANLGQILKM